MVVGKIAASPPCVAPGNFFTMDRHLLVSVTDWLCSYGKINLNGLISALKFLLFADPIGHGDLPNHFSAV